MPIVAVVEGVKIAFYANEHPPAHFHALIAEIMGHPDKPGDDEQDGGDE